MKMSDVQSSLFAHNQNPNNVSTHVSTATQRLHQHGAETVKSTEELLH